MGYLLSILIITTNNEMFEVTEKLSSKYARLYFNQILIAFYKLEIMSEVVLPLPNADCLLQVEDYVRGYRFYTDIKRIRLFITLWPC
jgi:hypothetical protein